MLKKGIGEGQKDGIYMFYNTFLSFCQKTFGRVQ